MKILYISFFYPPFNTIGGLRAYGQVEALRAAGCEVKVICSSNQGFEIDQKNSFLYEDTYFIGSKDLNLDSSSKKKIILSKLLVKMPRFINRYLYLLRYLLVGEKELWRKQCEKEYLEILENWSPDIIFSSQSPISSHQLASYISSETNTKWVAEFRDSWSFNPMAFSNSEYDFSSVILRIKERDILKNCSLVLAATNFIKEYYERHYDIDTYMLMGGWDSSEATSIKSARSKKMKITHLGSLLYGRRTIKPIIDLLQTNSAITTRYDFEFVGRHTNLFQGLLKESNLNNSVKLKDQVSYREAEEIGYNTDILLIIMMDNPQEKYTLTGKIFDYIKYQKPILIVDPYNSEASKLIVDYEMGHVFKNYKDFKNFLEQSKNLESFNKISNLNRENFKRTNLISNLVNHLKLNFELD